MNKLNINNPFESGHIKNYILFYAAIVVIVILFFIASTLFHDVDAIEKKVFNTDVNKTTFKQGVEKEEVKFSSKFKLLDKAY